MDSRESLLKALLSFTRPIPDIARDLSAYGWDTPDPLVELDAVHISSVLSRFMAGELSSVQVSEYQSRVMDEATKLSYAARMFRYLYGKCPNKSFKADGFAAA